MKVITLDRFKTFSKSEQLEAVREMLRILLSCLSIHRIFRNIETLEIVQNSISIVFRRFQQ